MSSVSLNAAFVRQFANRQFTQVRTISRNVITLSTPQNRPSTAINSQLLSLAFVSDCHGHRSFGLPSSFSGTRWFSNKQDDDERHSDTELKGVVVRVPNPLAWLKDKWYTYRIHSVIDPTFSFEEFLRGAKQALSFLTRLIVMNDMETLNTVTTSEAVEKVKQLIEPWSSEQQQSIEVLVEDISLASASFASVAKQTDCWNVFIDVLCIALKRHKTRPLLIQMTVQFVREYGTVTVSDWLISDIRDFKVRELTAAKGSYQRPK